MAKDGQQVVDNKEDHEVRHQIQEMLLAMRVAGVDGEAIHDRKVVQSLQIQAVHRKH